MVSVIDIADLEGAQGVQGVQGPQGVAGSGGLTTDAATAANIGSAGVTLSKSAVENHRNVSGAKRQAQLHGDFMRKLKAGVAVTICAMGDSTTYGHDTVSGDKVAAPVGALPDGSSHSFTRSPAPWPLILGQCMTQAYPVGVTVINRGYSGDDVVTAFPRWITSSGANMTLISFGINDATNLTVDQYIAGLEALVLREIFDYGAAVTILGPMKAQTSAGSGQRMTYGDAAIMLGAKYGIQVIPIDKFLEGYASDVFSDGTHLNTKGNSIVGARMAALFIGDGPTKPNRVNSGTRLGARPPIDGVTLAVNATASLTTAVGGMPEGTLNTQASVAQLSGAVSTATMFYTFFTESADLVLNLGYFIQNGVTLVASLDFDVEQPHDVNNYLTEIVPAHASRAPSNFSHVATADTASLGLNRDTRKIRVASPGWHTLRVRVTGAVGLVHYLEFMDFRGYRAAVASETPQAIPANALVSFAGAPALAMLVGSSFPQAWLLDSAATETLIGPVARVPADWQTFEVSAWWAPTMTGGGSVRWQAALSWLSEGALAGATTVTPAAVTTASSGTLGVLSRSVLATAVANTGAPLNLRISRLGADAADTYGADIGLVSIELRRLT